MRYLYSFSAVIQGCCARVNVLLFPHPLAIASFIFCAARAAHSALKAARA